MKLFIAALLLLASPAWAGKMLLLGAGAGTAGSFTPSCTASTNFLARASGITLTADKTNYDTLICGLNTDGVLAKLDALYIFAAPDSTTAKLNLVQNAFNGVASLTFTAYAGFTGDGTTAFDTGLIPSTGGTQFVLNNASFGIYNRTSDTASVNIIFIGAFFAFNDEMLINTGSTGNMLCAFGNGGSFGPVSITNAQGFLQCTRTDSVTVGGSKNGAALTNTTVSNPTGLDSVSLTIFCRHDGAGATYAGCTTNQLSAGYIGGTLTSTNIANMSSRVNTFMTAYGINVY